MYKTKNPTYDDENFHFFKVKIYPTEEQIEEIQQQFSYARAVYNMGLNIQNQSYENGEKHIQLFNMTKKFVRLKQEEKTKWLRQVPHGTICLVLRNLEFAFQKFFNQLANYPKFKSYKKSKPSVPVRSDRCRAIGRYVSISGFKNKMILAKNHGIPEKTRLYDTHIVSDRHNYYFCGSYMDYEYTHIDMSDVEKTEVVGLDVGVVHMIVSSDGTVYDFPDTSKYIKRAKQKEKRLIRSKNKLLANSTKTKYDDDIQLSKNHYKRLDKYFKLRRKVTNMNNNAIHTATKRIVEKNPEAIVIENLQQSRILREEPWMRKHSQNMYFAKIRECIEYKARYRGIPVIVADSNFPSTKTCSRCGGRGWTKHRVFHCKECGYVEDRDLNAAYNLRNLAYQ